MDYSQEFFEREMTVEYMMDTRLMSHSSYEGAERFMEIVESVQGFDLNQKIAELTETTIEQVNAFFPEGEIEVEVCDEGLLHFLDEYAKQGYAGLYSVRSKKGGRFLHGFIAPTPEEMHQKAIKWVDNLAQEGEL